MVENFTKEQTQEVEFINEEKANLEFEAKLKENLKSSLRAPSQQVIDNILNYSKSLQK